MIYIKLDSKKEISFLEKLKYKIKGFEIESIEEIDSRLITLREDSGKTLNKLENFLNQNCINSLCISNELLSKNNFMEFIKENKISYYDGRWLFKNLTEKIIDYIMNLKNERLDYQEITFVTDHIDKTIVYFIEMFSQKVKLVNVVTKNEKMFKKLKDKLYNEYGIILNFPYGPKAFLKSDIILNYDYSEDEINNFIIPRRCVLINFEECIEVKTKSFNGINVVGYKIDFDECIKDKLQLLEGFDRNLLYESLIYKNTLPENINRIINIDKIKIVSLLGKKGEIKKSEYIKNIKKVVNSLDKTGN